MNELIQIEGTNTYHWRKMKTGGDRFQAKKTQGGMFYWIILPGGFHGRHLARVVEELSVEDTCQQ